jgi:hypothetical protein
VSDAAKFERGAHKTAIAAAKESLVLVNMGKGWNYRAGMSSRFI